MLPETFFFDTTTFLPMRELRPVIMKGEKQELRSDYADYRAVERFKLPYSIVQTLPGSGPCFNNARLHAQCRYR